jgi:hypothetical protein
VNDTTKDIAYPILDRILEAFEIKPDILEINTVIDNSPRPDKISLSMAGKGARYLAMAVSGAPKKDIPARSRANMDMGTIAHDYIRAVLASHPEIEVEDGERTVTLKTEDGKHEINGHIDGFMKVDGQRILFDIKCVDHYSFNDLDPRNTYDNWWTRTRKWSAGNYVFEGVEAFTEEMFKREYLYQLAGYEEALASADEKWDLTVFILYNRNTSHLAVGLFQPDTDQWDALVGEAGKNMFSALSDPDPYNHDTCHPAAVGAAPHMVCQYCPYTEECFTMDVQVFRGKPQMKIKEIK